MKTNWSEQDGEFRNRRTKVQEAGGKGTPTTPHAARAKSLEMNHRLEQRTCKTSRGTRKRLSREAPSGVKDRAVTGCDAGANHTPANGLVQEHSSS